VASFLDWALVPPARWLHIPNGGKRDAREAARLKGMGVKAGAADVLILSPSWKRDGHWEFVWIELKSATGSLSRDQKDWRDWCRSIGAPWFLCRSRDDVIAACEDAGVPLKARAS
jgi:hypothetical protein